MNIKKEIKLTITLSEEEVKNLKNIIDKMKKNQIGFMVNASFTTEETTLLENLQKDLIS